MNASRYNLILYDEMIVYQFLELCFKNKGKIISSVRYAYILHDSDIIEETGEYKKAHYHLWLEFSDSVKDSYLVPMLEAVGSNASAIDKHKTDRNFLAYLTHDTTNSEGIKAHYKVDDIVTNIEHSEFLEMYYEAISKVKKPNRQKQRIEDTSNSISQVMDIVVVNDYITCFFDLSKYLIDNNELELLDFICKKPYFVEKLLKERFKYNSINIATRSIQNSTKKDLAIAQQEFNEAVRLNNKLEDTFNNLEVLKDEKSND